MGKRRSFLVRFDTALEPHEVRQVTAEKIRRVLWGEVPHAPEACVQVSEIPEGVTIRLEPSHG